jgi:uncharacterized membrane protein YecN with MAPEG domain
MDLGTAGAGAALWTGLHLILLLVLSVLVVRQRQRHRVALGDEGIPELAHAIRAFGNASEYVPAGVAGLAVMAVVGAPPLAVHVAGLLLFCGRVAHAIGLSNSGGATLLGSTGMVLTWTSYVFAAVALLFYAIV